MLRIICIHLLLHFFFYIPAQTNDLDRIQKSNRLIELLNQKVEFINSMHQSISEYNRRLYTYYIKRDSLAYAPFVLKNYFGKITIDESKIAATNDEIRKLSEEINLFDLGAKVSSLIFYESQLINIIRKFDMRKDYNFTKPYADATNDVLSALKDYFDSIQKAISSIRLNLRKLVSYNPEKENETLRLGTHLYSAIDSMNYGTISSLRYVDTELGVEKYRELPFYNEKTFEGSRIKQFKDFVRKYVNRFDIKNDEFFFKKAYYNDPFPIQKYKVAWLAHNQLVSLMAEKDSLSDPIVDILNQDLKSRGNKYQLFLKPTLTFDPLYLTRGVLKKTERVLGKPTSFVVLLVDASGSMAKENRLERVKDALKKVVDTRRYNDYLGIILFSEGNVILVQPDERDYTEIKKKIDKIQIYGETFPESGIANAYNLFKGRELAPLFNRVIMITDGNFRPTGNMKEIIAQGNKKGITFSIIKIKGDAEEADEAKNFQSLIKQGNGVVYYLDKNGSLEDLIYKEIVR